MSTAIAFKNVSKRFNLSHQPQRAGASFWRQLLARRGDWNESFWALRDVSLAVAHGETVGLIGSNGSGKSTILKLIAKIISPTSGDVTADGRVAAILELGAGFHHELSGRENIFFNGAMLGLTRSEIDRVYDEVVAFSELERFIDTPVKFYSSGMYARLAFAVAIHVKPNILLIDEALSVGDQAFQSKCIARVMDIKREGATILVVSHELGTIQSLCERAIWLDNGRVRDVGAVSDVVTAYLDHTAQKADESGGVARDAQRTGTGKVQITRAELCDGRGYQRDSFVTGGALILRLHYSARMPVADPVFGLAVYHQNGVLVSGPNTGENGLSFPMLAGDGMVTYHVSELPLLDGDYLISVSVNNRQGTEIYDYRDRICSFRVFAGKPRERFGLVTLHGQWQADTAPGSAAGAA
ncbi:MAG: ABC transporter ATP-binding protein [Chloroflexi bacterium]|nr:ABC transporter ATP-binding protein [Chloroflexota bacterium]